GFVRQWLSECKGLSPRTLEKYRDTTEAFCQFLNADESKPLLREIRPEATKAFIRQKRAATSDATARIHRKVLSAFFAYAVDNNALQSNPVPRARVLKLETTSDSERRGFTLDELKIIYSKAPSPFWRYMIIAGFYMGQRMGDLITMPWGAVDFD